MLSAAAVTFKQVAKFIIATTRGSIAALQAQGAQRAHERALERRELLDQRLDPLESARRAELFSDYKEGSERSYGGEDQSLLRCRRVSTDF